MPRICVEIVGKGCKYCFEIEGCTAPREIADKVAKLCGTLLDPESVIYVVNGKTLGDSTQVCTDADIKVVRVLRGGVS